MNKTLTPAQKAGRTNHDRWKIVQATLTEILRDVESEPSDRVTAAHLLREIGEG